MRRPPLVLRSAASAATWKASVPRRLQHVRVRGLRPDTAYSYCISVRAPGAVKPAAELIGRFRTDPAKVQPVTFLAYGDSRSRPDEHAKVVAAMLKEKDARFVLHTGDLV